MRAYFGILLVGVLVCCSPLYTHQALALPNSEPRLEPMTPVLGARGVRAWSGPGPAGKVLQDTTWIADWSFDPGPDCVSEGWSTVDHHVLNDGIVYWQTDEGFDGMGAIVGKAAVLTHHDLCWVDPDGYGNNWDQSIILGYQDGSVLSFDFLADTSGGDFFYVETDSLGLSEVLAADDDPPSDPSGYRDKIFTFSGVTSSGSVNTSLTAYGSGTHEAYLRFSSDEFFSDEDGNYDTALEAAVVVDQVQVSGPSSYTEDFEGALDPNITFANTAPAASFGLWARLYEHITDNDPGTENETCAWLFTDPTYPAQTPFNNYGPDGVVVRNLIDNSIVSPWVDLSSTPGAEQTLLSFRVFGGNDFDDGKIVSNWSVRAKIRIDDTDTPMPGDSIDCIQEWRHENSWNTLGFYEWATAVFDMTPHIDSGAREVQIRFRVSDWSRIAGDPPPLFPDPGPGPYVDRFRIGRYLVPTGVTGRNTFAFSLASAHPIRHHALLTYRLPQPVPVRLDVYNVAGRHVALLVDRMEGPGSYVVSFDPSVGRQGPVGAGVYFMRLRAGSFEKSLRAVLLH